MTEVFRIYVFRKKINDDDDDDGDRIYNKFVDRDWLSYLSRNRRVIKCVSHYRCPI